MNCREARAYLFSFLDSELDDALSVELQRHLEHCCACAREAEIERHIREVLKASMRRDGEAPPFEEKRIAQTLLARADGRTGGRSRWGRWSRRVRHVSAAALIAVLAAGALFNPWDGRRGFANLLMADLEDVVESDPPLDVTGSDPASLRAWTERTLRWRPVLPAVNPSGYTLRGARRCALFGRDAVLMLYEVDGAPASLVILHADATDLRGMRPSGSSDHVVDRCRDYTVVARREGALIYAAVGKLPEHQLVRLLGAGDGDTPLDP